MKTISEVSTVPAPTLGETPSAVSMTPNTIHGCRPISVKIQPNELAKMGMNGSATVAGGPATCVVGAAAPYG